MSFQPAEQSSRIASPSPSRSQASLSQTRSVRSQLGGTPKIRTIVTNPPWARDEPPSPEEDVTQPDLLPPPSIQARPSQTTASTEDGGGSSTVALSTQQSHLQKGGTSWWTFNHKFHEGLPHASSSSSKPNWPSLNPAATAEKWTRPLRGRSKTWLGGNSYFGSHEPKPHLHDEENNTLEAVSEDHEQSGRPDLRLSSLPSPDDNNFTLTNSRTPGWATPWAPRPPQPVLSQLRGAAMRLDEEPGNNDSEDEKDRSTWYLRRKRLRSFFLNNNLVPLGFRLINIAFTTASLAVAIEIRQIEKKYGVMGAVGSSPTIVIIFAPLTLIHVMTAIYLEYFGRPLGLWRTSVKLIHTLSDTFFVCAWSAALSLAFDNFFTSLIGCASPSATSWYSQLPRPIPDVPNLGHGEGEPGDRICDRQVALISLIFVGLIMYCSNLFISLFRIFEKVKYHPITHA